MKQSCAVIARLFVAVIMSVAGVGAVPQAQAEGAVVHAVVDLSHNFSFYGDGRFARQYLEGHKAETSWNALYKFDLSNANLLVLLDCAPQIEYVEQDVAVIRGFLEEGGGVVLFGSEEAVRQGELAQVFGAKFVKGASRPCKPTTAIGEVQIESYANAYLSFERPEEWLVVVTDADNRAVAAIRRVGRGSLLVISRCTIATI